MIRFIQLLSPEGLIICFLRSRIRVISQRGVNYTFGPYKIHCTEVFHSTVHSFATVNLRPLLPGHVLVCPRREVKCFIDLTADVVCDLWPTAKEVGGCLERHHEASSLTFAIQDEPQAGQTVPHVHIFILPRKKGDFEKNDEIHYADEPQAGQTVPHVHIFILPRKKGDFEKNDEIHYAIDLKEKELKEKLDLDRERRDRTPEEMDLEADEYRALFS
ncbi:bifunctional bis(5'-adenosyl)-triphosphatase/adenylylsulfatase FHIT [Musa acuminata AAA Group]|uniref:bifunctional bis(5'-adenosyl)-triphosphatase/adenylylsulfatase FHIT n=1 Tax=Musa acuminata AAA Group TaxID=214697 RepID=UPI0031D5FCC4